MSAVSGPGCQRTSLVLAVVTGSPRRPVRDAAGIARSLVFATDVLEPLGELTALAEAAGLQRVWTTDFPGRDALTRAVYLALGSSTIGVGTGIAYAFGRSPEGLAVAAADAQLLAHGRFVLGLGTGTRGVRRLHGVDFEPPATRLAEVVGCVRAAWERSGQLGDVAPPPIAGAGLNEAMLRTVGRVCDRVLLAPLCLVRGHLDDRALPAVAAGAGRRSDEAPAIAAWCIASVDADREPARTRARRQIAFYLSRPGYGPALEGTSWKPVAELIRARIAAQQGRAAPDWDELGDLVPDDAVDEIALAGTPAEVALAAQRMERDLAQRGIDELVLQVPGIATSADELVATTRQLVAALASGGA